MRSVQNGGGEVLVPGSAGVERFPYGTGIIFAHPGGCPAQQRVPQFALKVSSGTFQFNLSPPVCFFFTMWNWGVWGSSAISSDLLLFCSHSSSEKGKAHSLQWSSLYSLFFS